MIGSDDSPASWDFPYEPLSGGVPAAHQDDDLVIATVDAVTPMEVARALAPHDGDARVEILLARAPLFWLRLRTSRVFGLEALRGALAAADIAVRYVAPARRTSAVVSPRLHGDRGTRARASDWRVRKGPRTVVDPDSPTRWFLHADSGIALDRRRCGTGRGTRLAIIDDDGADAHRVGLDREVPVGVDSIRRASTHGTLIAAWAVGTTGDQAFAGVAPAASPRLYVIPSAGTDVVSLPVAIARAVFDGADVVVCATYVEQSWSPMLDDALAVASRLGRRGLGTAIVMPSGREASSPPGSSHGSWSLALGDPASDPRVFCVGPSGREGGWFLWRDRRDRLRPFANRGPAVRWLAPGDDLADPLEPGDRWCHAESSGAAAIAAGVLLLVLASNPTLRVRELADVVTRTTSPVPSQRHRAPETADPFDLLPHGTDPDGHNAKHGYGRMNVRRACLAARDPIAAELLAMGEEDAATRACDLLSSSSAISRRAARWIVRRLLSDRNSSHALRAVLRHLRLVAAARSPAQARRLHGAHGAGTLARQTSLLLNALLDGRALPERIAGELTALGDRLRDPSADDALLDFARQAWPKLAKTIDSVDRMRYANKAGGGSAESPIHAHSRR